MSIFLNDKPPVQELQQRITLNYRPISMFGMNLKVMAKSYQDRRFILCITDEVTNF